MLPQEKNAGHYVVTAHRPGGVITSIKCSFVEPNSVVSLYVPCYIFFRNKFKNLYLQIHFIHENIL